MAESSIPPQDGPAQVYMQNFADVIAPPVVPSQKGTSGLRPAWTGIARGNRTAATGETAPMTAL